MWICDGNDIEAVGWKLLANRLLYEQQQVAAHSNLGMELKAVASWNSTTKDGRS